MREVRIKDSLSDRVTALERDREVGIYACGPTVYSRIHIGNARPYVIFMLFARFLRDEGYEARLVINVTDVNDKIYAAAGDEGVPSEDLARRMTEAYVADTDALGIGRPDSEPLATETVAGIIEMIETLVGRGYAYESGGDVYYRVSRFGDYGKLSNRRSEDMDQGEEAGSVELKESPLDFALWKARKPDEDTSWDSPWGPGRPGWHIECSAMAQAELGPQFAVHGGGSDLVFPHHENEIAQSEAANGVTPARVWMHNGMIETDSSKMSKSEGNIFQLSEAVDRFGAAAVLAFLTSGHYRQPLAFSAEALEAARSRIERFTNYFTTAAADDEGDGSQASEGGWLADGKGPGERCRAAEEAFREALADDFNTPRAWAEASELLAAANRGEAPGARVVLARMMHLLGLDAVTAARGAGASADREAEQLLAEREEARAARDFERSDAIRDRLAGLGWEVRDSPEGARLIRRAP